MKNVLKSLSFLMVLGAIISFTSCGSDDDDGINIPIGGGNEGSYNVADGLYIAGVVTSDSISVASAARLTAAPVEDEGFSSQDRDGFVRAWVYLEAGNYVFADIADKEVAAFYGGTKSAETVDPSNADQGPDTYDVVALAQDGSAFSIATAGVYYISFDDLTDEALIISIGDFGVLGGSVYSDPCTGVGFSSDVVLEKGESSASGTTWAAEGVILRSGEVKFRMNNVWKVDRRVDPEAGFVEENGYVAFLNLGGASVDVLVDGGPNIPFTDADGGTYTITMALSATGSFSVTLDETGAAEECAFNPDNFTWGIIGSATQGTEATAGWSADKKLFYAGQGGDGTHFWRGLFPLAGGAADNAFKFRTDDTWATKLTTQNVTFTNNTETGVVTEDDNNGDGQWLVSEGNSGFYYVIISTSDDGATWDLMVDEAFVGVVGAGSPAAAWPNDENPTPDLEMTYNDDLASLSIIGSFTTDGWKIRMNQAWDFNLGGTLDGTTPLNFNGFGDDFILESAGAFTLTISTADGGVTYTGSVAAAGARQ